MTTLSVNVNKIATLRNARGGNVPNVLQVALDCEKFGAQGITVHPRPDGRHIHYQDVLDLKPSLTTEFNIEGYPSTEFIALILQVRPHQVTLVPDPPEAITSNAGWDCIKHRVFLTELVQKFQAVGVRVSIFSDTDLDNIAAAVATGTDRIELYTEPYAKNYKQDRELAIAPFVAAAEYAHSKGVGVNAGHDLSLENLQYLHTRIPLIKEVSIGHALVADALYLGLEKTIEAYRQCLK